MNKYKILIISFVILLVIALGTSALFIFTKNKGNISGSTTEGNKSNTIIPNHEMNLEFELDGKNYVLGEFTMQTLIDNGWEPNLEPTNVETLNGLLLDSSSGKGFSFLNSNYPDFYLIALSHNYSDEEAPILSCPVTNIEFNGLYSLRADTLIPNLVISNGVTWKCKYSDLSTVYGEPTLNEDNESLTWEFEEQTEDKITNKTLWVMINEEFGLAKISMTLDEKNT